MHFEANLLLNGILKQVFDREVLDSEARTRRAQTESVQDDGYCVTPAINLIR